MATATSWEISTSAANWFPWSDGDRLKDENNYLPWSICMLSVYDNCRLKGIVTGLEVEGNAADKPLWKKKDLSALNVLMSCIASNLVIKISTIKSSKNAWDLLTAEFGQSGTRSVMLWFHWLVK
ncbi:hypothetical protein K438DRAFT_1962430 [Mycena galopus ATCC 62051]|nr:hypothetical protein K438DRAFT_1962430 [Mycena galopus ATCC 62051]